MTINCLITTEIISIRKTTIEVVNHLITKRSSKTLTLSIRTNSIIEIIHETFTTSKYYFHLTSISILIKNITNTTFNLMKSKELTISFIVCFITNLNHTGSMRNRITILRISKNYFTILITIILSKPKTLFINPKISCTTTLSLKFVTYYSIRKITTNLFRITMEFKLTCHLTWTHNITTITITERLTNSRSSHRPIFTNSKKININISIRIRIG